MHVMINGKMEEVSPGLTLSDLIAQKNLNPKTIILEYNLEIIREEDWSDILLKDNDRLEIVKFVGGG